MLTIRPLTLGAASSSGFLSLFFAEYPYLNLLNPTQPHGRTPSLQRLREPYEGQAITATAYNPAAVDVRRRQCGHIPLCRPLSRTIPYAGETLLLPRSAGSPCHGGHRCW